LFHPRQILNDPVCVLAHKNALTLINTLFLYLLRSIHLSYRVGVKVDSGQGFEVKEIPDTFPGVDLILIDPEISESRVR
jgi:hypothetical protein